MDEPAATGSPRVLVAGIGNIFLGDDGFGSEVARRLQRCALPEGARVKDYGVGGIHLAYDVAEGVDLLVLVDTVARGAAPGTLTLLEVGGDEVAAVQVDAHAMDPVTMLQTVETLGGRRPRTLLVGCQPAEMDAGLQLSAPVAEAVERAVDAVLDLLAETATRGVASAAS